ncbi:MAG: 4Fe-4S binding protein [Firmicutes bacterium]|nr:4Fe-4S binding protein [Bacillota bacterium]
MDWTLTTDAPGRIVLMQGNEAIVRGAVESGIHFAASYPGSPSSQILGMLGKIAKERNFYAQWATNEVAAFQACLGTSLAGARSICIVKQNGLLCIADALFCAAQHGIKGGVVVVTSDDPGSHSSTNEFDSRHMALSASVPMLEPTNMQEAKDMVPYAFEISEQTKQVVIIRLTTRVCHGRGSVSLGAIPQVQRKLDVVDEWDRMVCVSFRHQIMLDSLEQARDLFEESPYNHYSGPAHPKKLIVAGGTGCLYTKEALGLLGDPKDVGLLQLGTIWPIPERMLLDKMRTAEEVLTVEEVDPFLEDALMNLAGREQLNLKFYGRSEGTINRVGELDPDHVLPAVSTFTGIPQPPRQKVSDEPLLERDLNFCAGCPHRATFFVLKQAMRREKVPGVVVGDIGCYFMAGAEPGQYAYQINNCMGSGINVAEGLGQLSAYGMDQPVVTMCGDSTFFHTVLPGLCNASYHNSNMTLIVLDNSATAMTGFQPHPGTGLTAMGDEVKPMSIRAICEAMNCTVEEADPFEIQETTDLLTELMHRPGLKVLIMKQPCATLMAKSRKEKITVWVDQNKCLGDGCGCDRFCSRVWGCPGNSWDFKAGKATIDPVSCVGCGVCAKLCPQGAIIVEREEAKA